MQSRCGGVGRRRSYDSDGLCVSILFEFFDENDTYFESGGGVSSDLATDFTVVVDDVTFHLHKYPLLSKSNKLQKLALQASEKEEDVEVIHLFDFPGRSKSFEICAKFCYGIMVSVSPYTVVAVRCAAEYLEMTEDVEKGNLIYKLEVFLKSSIYRSWKDSIVVLQSIMDLPTWSEVLQITSRCVESVAAKTAIDPACVNWSYNYNRGNRKVDVIEKVDETGMVPVPKDWWTEDLCELNIEVYKRVMCAVIAKKQVEGDVIGDALKTYCLRWLPDSGDKFERDEGDKYRLLIESIISLLTPDKRVSCSCSFLLKLLKVSILVGVDRLVRDELIKVVGLKLDEASVRDLLILDEDPKTKAYDVELVQSLVDQFFDRKNTDDDDVDGKRSDLVLVTTRQCAIIGCLIDGYLAEVACDPNLALSSFMALSRSIPEAGRPVHYGIYGAVDVYLKEHPTFTKSEKKRVCELIDVKRLSPNASAHAAHNDRLPLRMVVQILFHEQARATAAMQLAARSNRPHEHDWDIKVPLRSKSLRTPSRLKLNDCDSEKEVVGGGSMRLLPSRSRRILDRFWVMGMGRYGESKSSGTSGSSQYKSSSASSRKQRYSIS